MKLVETKVSDLYLIEPKVFGDKRGYFFESFNHNSFSALGLNYTFVQDNESYSSYGTLRGLHFQTGTHAQAKLVRVVKGEVLDVVVDLRVDSKTFGVSQTFHLTEENKHMVMVPRGFAHGFVVLSETAIFQYKCDNFYDPKNESGIRWNDSTLNIDWRVSVDKVLLSEKDLKLPSFKELYP